MSQTATLIDEKAIREQRLLIVDDEATIRDTYVEKFEYAGYKQVEALDPAAARSAIHAGIPYSMFLIDYKMPIVDGLRLARIIRDRGQYDRAPIVIMSGYEENGTDAVRQIKEDIIDSYAVKDVDCHQVTADFLRHKNKRLTTFGSTTRLSRAALLSLADTVREACVNGMASLHAIPNHPIAKAMILHLAANPEGVSMGRLETFYTGALGATAMRDMKGALEERGLIVSSPSPCDRRVMNVCLTDEGYATARALTDQIARAQGITLVDE